MQKRTWGLILLVFMYVTTGCATSSVQTARTNGEGNFQFGVEPGVIGALATGGGATAGGVFPAFNIAGRYGISDSVDIGARIGSVGYEIQTKFMFTDPADLSSTAISLAPAFTAIGYGGGGAGVGGGVFFAVARVPLLVGIPVGDSEFVVAPRVSPAFFAGGAGGESAGGFFLSAGGSAGFAARLGDKFWLMPEAGIDVPVVAGAVTSGGSGAGAGFGGFIFNATVGLLFGGRDRASAAAPPPSVE